MRTFVLLTVTLLNVNQLLNSVESATQCIQHILLHFKYVSKLFCEVFTSELFRDYESDT